MASGDFRPRGRSDPPRHSAEPLRSGDPPAHRARPITLSDLELVRPRV